MNTQTENKRFFIHTLGCKVNQYESQAMREILVKNGFVECASRAMSDIYILNTCTVTHNADSESRYWIGLFHRTNPSARIVVTGCYAEKNASEISFLPGVFRILKNEEKSRIAGILGSEAAETDPEPLKITDFKGHVKAFVKIQDGCENRCAYCKVPLVRGNLNSKPIENIVEEVKTLSCKGFHEIILTGICLGAWGRELGAKSAGLINVLKALKAVDGDFRIRLSSIEPKYVTDELIDYIAGDNRVCRHLHIPLQSSDDEILKKMNRPYSSDEYRKLILMARSKIEGVAVTTDVMVGFPGETDANFRNTVNFIKEIAPLRTHIFTFSRRPGTPAYNMKNEADGSVLKNRHNELNAVALSASYIYRDRFIGKRVEVLTETKREKHTGFLTGYSDNYIKVSFDGPDELMGRIVPVVIRETTLMNTFGEYNG